jgi:hypothetical protein
MALFGSPARWDLMQAHIASGQDLYYADHCYFRRSTQFRIARNRYQTLITQDELVRTYGDSRTVSRRGWAMPVPARFSRLRVDVAPEWNTSGNSIVICPNSPAYMKWFGHDAKTWALDVARTVSQYTDRPIVIRWKAQAQARPLYMDLHAAWAVVTFTSGAAMDALAAGIPVFCLADWATAYPMGCPDLTQIETPYYPTHRVPFLWELAERQWSLAEIAEGAAWRWFLSRPEDSI